MQITTAFVNEVAIFKDTLIQPICLIAQGDSYVIAHSWIFFLIFHLSIFFPLFLLVGSTQLFQLGQEVQIRKALGLPKLDIKQEVSEITQLESWRSALANLIFRKIQENRNLGVGFMRRGCQSLMFINRLGELSRWFDLSGLQSQYMKWELVGR